MLIYDPVYDENLLSGQPPLSGHLLVPRGRLMEVQLYSKRKLGHVVQIAVNATLNLCIVSFCTKTSTKTEAIVYKIQLLSRNLD